MESGLCHIQEWESCYTVVYLQMPVNGSSGDKTRLLRPIEMKWNRCCCRCLLQTEHDVKIIAHLVSSSVFHSVIPPRHLLHIVKKKKKKKTKHSLTAYGTHQHPFATSLKLIYLIRSIRVIQSYRTILLANIGLWLLACSSVIKNSNRDRAIAQMSIFNDI